MSDRVVTVSSFAHHIGRVKLDDLNWRARPYSAWGAYGQSKLNDLMFTSRLQGRLEEGQSQGPLGGRTPGYSATELQSTPAPTLSGRLMVIGNRLATTADFGAANVVRGVAGHTSNTFVGPRFRLRRAQRSDRPQPAGLQTAPRPAAFGNSRAAHRGSVRPVDLPLSRATISDCPLQWAT